MVQPSDHLHGFLWIPTVPLSSYVGLPRATHSTWGGDLQKQIRGRIAFLTLLAMLILIQTGTHFVLDCSITLLGRVKVFIQQHCQELLLTIGLNPFYIQFVLCLGFPWPWDWSCWTSQGSLRHMSQDCQVFFVARLYSCSLYFEWSIHLHWVWPM